MNFITLLVGRLKKLEINRMKHKYISKNIDDTVRFARLLSSELIAKDIICLSGELGTGKTVIAKEISKYFKVRSEVISPTFNILKIYDTSDNLIKHIYHYDLYRLKSKQELIDIGFEEYILYKDIIHIIEWPDIAIPLLQAPYHNVIINYDINNTNNRIINYEKIS